MRLASGWVAFALSCLPWCRCRPGPPLAGLISSLSDPKGRDPSQFRRAVTLLPGRHRPRPPSPRSNRMAILADTVEGARRRRHPPRAPSPPPLSPRSGGSSPRPRPAPTPAATTPCWTSPGHRSQASDAGRSRAPAAMAPDWPASCSPTASGSSKSAAPSGPPAQRRQSGAKSDAVDAIRAAREALAFDHTPAPRRRGDREALRVLLTTRHGAVKARVKATNQPQALVVGAPEELRAKLRGRSTIAQVSACARLRTRPAKSLEHRATVRALRATAQRIQLLQAEADALQTELAALVAAIAPWLLELHGVGPISAAQVLVSWSYAGRLHSEAAFAALAGVSPIPASSGQVTRHRPRPIRDRQRNRALHIIVVARLRDDPDTRAYAARRAAQGKSPREIRRCLKRFVARQLFKLLECCDQPGAEILRAA